MGIRTAAIVLATLAGLAAQDLKQELDVVRVHRADAGETGRFDPATVEKNYRQAVAALEGALSRLERQAPARLDDGYDSGLPDPTGSVRRAWKPSSPVPAPLRGVTIHVVTLDRNGRVWGLPEGPRRRGDVVLISRAARLKNCVRLGTMTLLTPELAASLGLQASRGRCVVSADGTEIEVIEGERP